MIAMLMTTRTNQSGEFVSCDFLSFVILSVAKNL